MKQGGLFSAEPVRRMMRLAVAPAALAILVAIGAGASAATLSAAALKSGDIAIALDGDIADGDGEAVEALMKEMNDSGKLVAALRLDSPGGSLAESVKIAELVQRTKIAVVVGSRARCASACFLIFAAGTEKFVGYGAAIGVHGASDKYGRITPRAAAATVSMARMVREFGVPPGIVEKLIVTGPDEIVWLSIDELRSMGAVITGRPRASLPVAIAAPASG
jgi:hypothetical protein